MCGAAPAAVDVTAPRSACAPASSVSTPRQRLGGEIVSQRGLADARRPGRRSSPARCARLAAARSAARAPLVADDRWFRADGARRRACRLRPALTPLRSACLGGELWPWLTGSGALRRFSRLPLPPCPGSRMHRSPRSAMARSARCSETPSAGSGERPAASSHTGPSVPASRSIACSAGRSRISVRSGRVGQTMVRSSPSSTESGTSPPAP